MAANGAGGKDATGKRKWEDANAARVPDTPAEPRIGTADEPGLGGVSVWKKKAEEYKQRVEELEEELSKEKATCVQLRGQRDQVCGSTHLFSVAWL